MTMPGEYSHFPRHERTYYATSQGTVALEYAPADSSEGLFGRVVSPKNAAAAVLGAAAAVSFAYSSVRSMTDTIIDRADRNQADIQLVIDDNEQTIGDLETISVAIADTAMPLQVILNPAEADEEQSPEITERQAEVLPALDRLALDDKTDEITEAVYDIADEPYGSAVEEVIIEFAEERADDIAVENLALERDKRYAGSPKFDAYMKGGAAFTGLGLAGGAAGVAALYGLRRGTRSARAGMRAILRERREANFALGFDYPDLVSEEALQLSKRVDQGYFHIPNTTPPSEFITVYSKN